MPTVQETVETVFKAVGGAAFTSQIKMMEKAAQGASGTVNRLGERIGSIRPLSVALGALAGGGALAGIVSVSSEFENMKINMAQTLKFMGQATTFPDAMQQADKQIQRIYAAAAALPGEAEDYAKAMQMAGANVQRATGDTEKSFDLIKNLTAVGVSFGRSAEETAMQLNRALNTERGMLEVSSDYTNDLVNAMKAIPGYATITAAKFNKMNVEERVKLMTQLTGQFDDMIAESSNTWDAVAGATSTTFKTLVRMSSASLFEEMKGSLSRINSLFMDGNGELTNMGKLVQQIGGRVGSVLGKAFGYVASSLEYVSANLFSILGGLEQVFGPIMGGGAGNIGTALAAIVPVIVASLTPLGPLGLLLSVGLGNFLSRTDDVAALMSSFGDLFTTVMQVVQPAISFFDTFSVMLGDMIAGILPGLMDGLNSILDPIMILVVGLLSLYDSVANKLRPVFEQLWEAVGGLFRAIGNVLKPVLLLLAEGVLTVYETMYRYLEPVITSVAEAFTWAINRISDFLNWLGKIIGEAAKSILPERGAADRDVPGASAIRDLIDSLRSNEEAQETATAATTLATPRAPSARGGGKTVQDFRYSRFDISQQFDKEFTPDRIAVAFSQDLGRIGEQRLQSGFEPAFGLR